MDLTDIFLHSIVQRSAVRNGKTNPTSHDVPLFKSYCIVHICITRLGNWDVKVREFAVVFPITVPKPGRVEEEINKISRIFVSHFQSMDSKFSMKSTFSWSNLSRNFWSTLSSGSKSCSGNNRKETACLICQGSEGRERKQGEKRGKERGIRMEAGGKWMKNVREEGGRQHKRWLLMLVSGNVLHPIPL